MVSSVSPEAKHTPATVMTVSRELPAPPVSDSSLLWRAPEGPEGTAVPVGAAEPGCGARGRRWGPAAVPVGGGVRLWCPWAVTGPSRGAGGWRQGQGGPRDRPLRAAGSRVAISRAGRRPPAHTAAGPHKAARPHAAPGTPVAPQATPSLGRAAAHRHTQRPGSPAPGTPVGATSHNQGKQKPQIPKDLRFHRARGGS